MTDNTTVSNSLATKLPVELLESLSFEAFKSHVARGYIPDSRFERLTLPEAQFLLENCESLRDGRFKPGLLAAISSCFEKANISVPDEIVKRVLGVVTTAAICSHTSISEAECEFSYILHYLVTNDISDVIGLIQFYLLQGCDDYYGGGAGNTNNLEAQSRVELPLFLRRTQAWRVARL